MICPAGFGGLIIGQALLIAIAVSAAVADTPCDMASAAKQYNDLLGMLDNPDGRATLDAARADFAEDQDIDSQKNEDYLALLATTYDLSRSLNAGDVEGACQALARQKARISRVRSGE